MPVEALGPYEILKESGRSPVGRVLLARERATARDVTIQLFESLEGLPAPERDLARRRVREACGPLVGLDASQIAGVLGVDEAHGVTYVVTECVPGSPFTIHCRAGALLPEAEVLERGAAAARGLDAAHRVGAVHGAVHPGVLLRSGGTVKVAGFGLGVCAPVGEETAHYLSPEQVRREPLDPRSDLFSLGAVLYEMLTGHKAFPGASVSTVLYRIVNEPVRDVRELAPGVHGTTAELLARALAKAPQERFADGATMARALEEAALVLGVEASLGLGESGSPTTPSPAPATPARPTPKRSSLRPFLLGAILVALVSAVVFALMRGRRTADLPPEPLRLEALVRTEPPGLPLLLDGAPVVPDAGGKLGFAAAEPPPVLSATLGCRTAERRLDREVAGGEIVLVLDPLEVDVTVESGVARARVALNGRSAGALPETLRLDLCRPNRVQLEAPGHRTAAVDLPAGSTPLEAKKSIYALALAPLPRGRLAFPRPPGLELAYHVDGERIDKAVSEVELDEGQHVLRVQNDFHWLDQTLAVQVTAGETATPDIAPRLGTLVVQAYPANCRVFLRRPGGDWRYLDDTPAERRVATGTYEVQVQLIPTGEKRVQQVQIGEGKNPALRVSFGGRG